MADNSQKSKRIAKNTGILYLRMIFLMLITLYTSRVILDALGVEDYGVYNVVGGFVAMFSVLSKALTSASTRFINFEMGQGDFERLRKVFSTSLTIQWILVAVIFVLCEFVGCWYVNNIMVIDPSRLTAANWVFQFYILTFCSSLITVPYNAAIIAHERMSTFAYVSIFEGVAKLIISFAVIFSPIDTLIFYALLIFILQISIQGMYRIYCRRNFKECTSRFNYDKDMIKEMFGYAGWTFVGTSAAVLRNQGGNVLINLFFGPAVNAARGIANQVLHAVSGFVTNFTLALDPQITQSYARGEHDYMLKLVYAGSRMSYFLLLFLCLPIIINADYILHIWLKNVPDYAIVFTQLTLIFTMVESISHTLIKAQQATGEVKKYQIIAGTINLLNLPISYIILKLGGSPESFLLVAVFIALICLYARIVLLRKYVNLSVKDFFINVLFNIMIVTIISVVLPIFTHFLLPQSFWGLCVNSLLCILSAGITILYIGCRAEERKIVYSYIVKFKKKVTK